MIKTDPNHPNLRHVVHPLIQQKLSHGRKIGTKNREFRQVLGEIATLMVYELTSDYPTREVTIRTPMEEATGHELGSEITLVPILRAGLGMADGVLHLIPQARMGHIGLYRDEESLTPVTYYCKLPSQIAETDVIVIDPMLATGGSVIAALNTLKEHGVTRMKFLCLVAAPEGMNALMEAHPDVEVFAAGVDRELNESGYILPGLGDAGDRIFGTE